MGLPKGQRSLEKGVRGPEGGVGPVANLCNAPVGNKRAKKERAK